LKVFAKKKRERTIEIASVMGPNPKALRLAGCRLRKKKKSKKKRGGLSFSTPGDSRAHEAVYRGSLKGGGEGKACTTEDFLASSAQEGIKRNSLVEKDSRSPPPYQTRGGGRIFLFCFHNAYLDGKGEEEAASTFSQKKKKTPLQSFKSSPPKQGRRRSAIP